jgi:CBS domain-containing protein
MFEQPLREVMDKTKLLLALPSMLVIDAVRAMARADTSAVVVIDDGRVIGIFTESDAVLRVMVRGADPTVTCLADVMTPAPRALSPDKPFGLALALMHKHGFRHVPVVTDGKPVGIVSARSALDPDMEDFVAESRRRDHFLEMH